jgi:hypothetical protein
VTRPDCRSRRPPELYFIPKRRALWAFRREPGLRLVFDSPHAGGALAGIVASTTPAKAIPPPMAMAGSKLARPVAHSRTAAVGPMDVKQYPTSGSAPSLVSRNVGQSGAFLVTRNSCGPGAPPPRPTPRQARHRKRQLGFAELRHVGAGEHPHNAWRSASASATLRSPRPRCCRRWRRGA